MTDSPSLRERLINNSVFATIAMYDWILWIVLAASITTLTKSAWALLFVWLAWSGWRIFIQWEQYTFAVDTIYNTIQIMKKGKFVWKKDEVKVAEVKDGNE